MEKCDYALLVVRIRMKIDFHRMKFLFSGTCDRFAMKIVGKKHFASIGPQANIFNKHIKAECSILQALEHPCIIRIYDVHETDDALYIILELVEGGELFERIVAHGQFDEATTKFLFRQMAIGVKYLHEHSITHRDLKPENILLSSPETNETLVKITDFGLSKFISESSLLKTFCGTPTYLGKREKESFSRKNRLLLSILFSTRNLNHTWRRKLYK